MRTDTTEMLKDFSADGFLTDLIHLKQATGSGKSGFCVLSSGLDALCARAALIDEAQTTIDIQYYLFQDDASGYWLAEKLLEAAERGVKVRVLIDDINLLTKELKVGLVDRHPNIELRRFNPFTTGQQRGVLRWAEMIWNFTRSNRRMHNKSLIVDNIAAIIGGRNIGDEYFEIHPQLDFFDLDLLTVGPIADDLRVSFETYWNSRWVRPVSRFKRARVRARIGIRRLRLYLRNLQRPLFSKDYAEKIATWDFPRKLRSGELPFVWDDARVVADPPEKIPGVRGDEPYLFDRLRERIAATETELQIVSPYFIPGHEGVAAFEKLRERNVAVDVLTNSLSANNWPVVHSGYSRYRGPLLRLGVSIYELKRKPGTSPAAFRWFRLRTGSSSGACLHAKYFVFDRRTVFVGSFNLDPRSILFNTEMGLFIESRELAEQLASLTDAAMNPWASYQVVLPEKASLFDFLFPTRFEWISEEEGVPRRWKREPDSTRLRCFVVWLLTWLPIEKYL